MFDPKRILVPVDYSDGSLDALRCALDLARPFGAEVEIVHFWWSPYFEPSYIVEQGTKDTLFDLIRENATKEMEAFVARASVPDGVRITQHIESADATQGILALIDRTRPGLVVAGTHGRTGPKRWVLGSVAERLVQLAPAPVLTVPPRGEGPSVGLSNVRRILAPVDLSAHSRRSATVAFELAQRLDASVDIIHVVKPPPYVPLDVALIGNAQDRFTQDIEDELDRFVRDTPGSLPSTKRQVEWGIPYDVILQAAESADLVVMATRGRTGLPHMMLGSVAERVVRGTPCPVLSLSPRE